MAIRNMANFTGRPDPLLQLTYICPHCRYNCRPMRTVNESEMICPVCGRHLRRWDIHDSLSKKPKHYFMKTITKIPLIGR
jgi:predicted amidophosphoribosyltransferase